MCKYSVAYVCIIYIRRRDIQGTPKGYLGMSHVFLTYLDTYGIPGIFFKYCLFEADS